ncbi:hypothetical protein E8E13_003495 [Curvularia kusanoi]|uniref:Alpha/beta hydrolase fold-3 domain-containing protein n=1 Tax=Curvularia kusanoi TaxID=90978 RepID=A0A9P4WDI1_CURKU|nr:hypothetical protein E8E13_003495 [Curvularia kusanoi]
MTAPPVYLDPLNQAFADAAATQPPLESLTVEQFRTEVDLLQQHEPMSGVTRSEFTVPFEDGVKTYVFKPDGFQDYLPVVFFFHGGAWIGGNVSSHDSLCRDIATQTGFAVVFPEYTLAPEARYPTQHEQCYALVKWVKKHGNTKGLSQDLFAIVGDSAGGQLTTAVTILTSTRKPLINIAYQVLISPVTDTVTTDRDTPSEHRFFDGPFLSVPFMRKAIDAYIPEADDRTSELATARNITAKDAARQPPTLIINSAADILRDHGILYGEILQKAGVDVAIITGHGQLHDSLLFEAVRSGATSQAMVRLMTAQLKQALKGAETSKRESSKRLRDEVGEESTKQPAKRRARRDL